MLRGDLETPSDLSALHVKYIAKAKLINPKTRNVFARTQHVLWDDPLLLAAIDVWCRALSPGHLVFCKYDKWRRVVYRIFEIPGVNQIGYSLGGLRGRRLPWLLGVCVCVCMCACVCACVCVCVCGLLAHPSIYSNH